MLLLHQIGSVKIGEIVRYTVTYTPAHDRILPGPEYLYLRIRNTSNSALRAAFVHGPYTLYVDAYPAHFDPNEKFEHPRQYGVPEFEPMLKAGGTWTCRLIVPEHIRHDAGNGGGDGHNGSGSGSSSGGGGTHSSGDLGARPSTTSPLSASWIINVSSQVIFSTSAAVHYEVLLARDPKSLDSGGGITSGMPVLLGGSGSGGAGGGSGGGGHNGTNSGQAQVLQPGRVSDYQRGRDGFHPEQPRGVFSRAIRLRVEDTATLWNKPLLPGLDKHANVRAKLVDKAAALQPETTAVRDTSQLQQQTKTNPRPDAARAESGKRQPIKVHLVILTHGLHSNLSNDMLYMKESIDAAVQQAKVDRKVRKAREREAAASAENKSENGNENDNKDDNDDDDDDDGEEEVMVRGYPGNATKTEKGIKYLGKRLARYVLSMTYPDQPFLPSSKAATAERAALVPHGDKAVTAPGSRPSHKHSTIQKSPTENHRPYTFTKISFVAHSLGGLVQTYAVAYIQKHSPQFFDLIQPVNFISMASPFLGLNHENPLYVKFALDFGLVGRTGQDLGLTWRAPTIARSGWGALVSNLSENAHKRVLGEPQPESKPLLRILPTGPAHTALKKFRNRTVYSNVVNDGIVPLRTSCLLFLDWQGLGRVEKARREAGLVETVVGFGWAELIGTNVTTPRPDQWDLEDEDGGDKEGQTPGQPGGEEADASLSPPPVDDGAETASVSASHHDEHEVPQPSANATQEDDRVSLRSVTASHPYRSNTGHHASSPPASAHDAAGPLATGTTNNTNPFSSFFSNLFKSSEAPSAPSPPPPPPPHAPAPAPASSPLSDAQPPRPPAHTSTSFGNNNHHHHQHKQNKIYQRSQTLRPEAFASSPGSKTSSVQSGSNQNARDAASGRGAPSDASPAASAGGTGASDMMTDGVSAPPRTSFFESATDIINPKLPSVEFLIDPAKRPRTIFHDRVYHPSDIPPPPLKRRPTGTLALRRKTFQQRSKSSTSVPTRASSPYGGGGGSGASHDNNNNKHQDSGLYAQDYEDPAAANPDREPDEVVHSASMKVEEKIARAYHRGLSWRKVLVKLEPDAHNNLVVRRMFANAFGWPVVKHMVDAHFSDSAAARMRDDDEGSQERAKPLHEGPDEHGTETTTMQSQQKRRDHHHQQTPPGDDADGKDHGADGVGGMPKPSDDAQRHTAQSDDETAAVAAAAAAAAAPQPEPHTQATSARSTPETVHAGEETPRSTGADDASTPVRARAVPEAKDSASWSERDWADSADESDVDVDVDVAAAAAAAAAAQRPTAPKPPQHKGDNDINTSGVSVTATAGTTTGPLSPLKATFLGDASWWEEKIAGKRPGRPTSVASSSSNAGAAGSAAAAGARTGTGAAYLD
ncbi:hydrolase-like, DUF676 domain containing protein [Niveomyces insectorum RCEF 264]|uniref:Hydrolase-like, DUF676 domain containing protein n=1 Tax=Niveomyces insectorum RCEF 264 TaxID=1081102 RepID=A0A167Y8A4_9HYPO|nr:hydrolase-like, DUF676 domain containing protein [Niveomyces insectorum RCEF 264]